MSQTFELLKRAAAQAKVAHLLLFHGSGSLERTEAGLELAAILNCTGEHIPCGECPACKKIGAHCHPDVHILRPPKSSIGIDQVLALQELVYRKIYEGKYKVCLIDQADKLTLPAANALLKIAEEPPANTILILSCGNAQGIIPTLQSRAQAVYFPAAAPAENEEEAEALALSGGDPDLARSIQDYGLENIKDMIAQYLAMVETGDFLKTFELFAALERENSLIFLQALAAAGKERIVQGRLSPRFIGEIGATVDAIRKQVNHRLAMEVMALKHISYGGNGNWLR